MKYIFMPPDFHDAINQIAKTMIQIARALNVEQSVYDLLKLVLCSIMSVIIVSFCVWHDRKAFIDSSNHIIEIDFCTAPPYQSDSDIIRLIKRGNINVRWLRNKSIQQLFR